MQRRSSHGTRRRTAAGVADVEQEPERRRRSGSSRTPSSVWPLSSAVNMYAPMPEPRISSSEASTVKIEIAIAIRTPDRMCGSAAGEHDAPPQRPTAGPKPARRPHQRGPDRGRAVVRRDHERDQRAGHDDRDPRRVARAPPQHEDEDQRRLRHRVAGDEQRIDQRLQRPRATHRQPERHPDDDGQAEPGGPPRRRRRRAGRGTPAGPRRPALPAPHR